ncbi:MAG: hypothetical protein Q4E47_00040 [Candidatus Saccharibacteria bacterium]|nr:hypothetical protein [Candidatus Saccharibacteria bacterium]
MADENFPTNNGEENNTPEQPDVKNISEALANVAVNETLSTEESEVHLPDQPRERASTIATFSPERHSDVLAVVGDSLSEERRDHIKQRSEEIDHLVNQEAIENLPNESLAPEVRRDCNALLAERINPGTLTPEELRKVAAFVNNETDEIREQKFSMTQDLITHSVGGLRNYRDYNFDPKKHAILMDLMDKGEAYDRGLIDTSAGFDIDAVRARDAETYDRHTARYDAAEADYNEDNEDYMSISDRKYFRESFLENMDAEELLEAGLIDEKDLFVYGGYTHRDLEQIEMFCKASYTTGMSPRVNRGVNKLITTAKLAPNESSVSDSESDLFDDLDDDEGLVEEGEKKDYLSTNIVSEKTFRSIY